jgi:tetratricopeptide (TPR) repeat protein
MSSIAEMIRQADEQLIMQLNVAAGLAAAADAQQLDGARSLYDAAVAARRALAERGRALDTAQLRIQQLDNSVVHLSRVLPFLDEGWAEQRDQLERAISQDARDGLASWLNYWFAAASSRQIDALKRLQRDVALPAAASTVTERMLVATRALAERDWQLCREVLQIGYDGVQVGQWRVPDWKAPGDQGPGLAVREELRLMAARLALHNGLTDQADVLLDVADQGQPAPPRLALRSRSARLRGAGGEAEALLSQARDLDPRDLDVTVESIAQARRRGEPDAALDQARSAVGSLLALNDIDGDIARLVDPPAELWIAAAERASDEGDRDGARRFLGRAAEIAPRDDDEIAATIAEKRAEIAGSPTERLRALVSAGERRISLGQLERARRNYEAADSPVPADASDADDARVRASARLRWADVVSAAAQQRPYRDVADELATALENLLAAQVQVDLSGAESWSYLTESDLRLRLSKAPGADDRYVQEWAALLAAARAVSLNPGWARPWLSLDGAAATCGLYRVAEAAAQRAHEIEADDTTLAGYVQALVSVGRYEDALGLLGNASDAWSQCTRGCIAVRLGQANEAVGHFAGVTVDPAWFWAWYSYICALIISGDMASARLKSQAFTSAAADREGERAWLYAAAFDARVHGRLDEALEFADRLSEAVGPGDVTALRARGETLVLRQDETGWTLLADALATDPLPTAVGTWNRQERPVLAALAADRGVELTVAHLDLAAVTRARAGVHDDDPFTELRRAAAASAAPAGAARAARLTEAALRAVAGSADQTLDDLIRKLAAEDGLGAEAESLSRYLTGSTSQESEAAGTPGQDGAAADVTAADPQRLRLRLPTSWLDGCADPGREQQLLVGYVPVPRPGRPWVAPRTEVSAGDDLEPDGYQILADDELRSSGHVDPALRYCPRETLSLLPEQVRANPRTVATDDGWGIPPDVLNGDAGLAALLTMSAAEVVALRYRDVAEALGVPLTAPTDDSRRAAADDIPPAPADLPPTPTHWLARRRYEMRSKLGSYGDALADWDAAQRLVSEAAYFRWIERGRPFGDPLTDWVAAETEIADSGKSRDQVSVTSVDERLRHQLTEEAAYFRWIERGRQFGDPLTDWAATEDEDAGGG